MPCKNYLIVPVNAVQNAKSRFFDDFVGENERMDVESGVIKAPARTLKRPGRRVADLDGRKELPRKKGESGVQSRPPLFGSDYVPSSRMAIFISSSVIVLSVAKWHVSQLCRTTAIASVNEIRL